MQRGVFILAQNFDLKVDSGVRNDNGISVVNESGEFNIKKHFLLDFSYIDKLLV